MARRRRASPGSAAGRARRRRDHAGSLPLQVIPARNLQFSFRPVLADNRHYVNSRVENADPPPRRPLPWTPAGRLPAWRSPTRSRVSPESSLSAIDRTRPGLLDGLFLHGSLCWGEFFPDSDVGFVGIVRRRLSDADLDRLAAAHVQLRGSFPDRRFEGARRAGSESDVARAASGPDLWGPPPATPCARIRAPRPRAVVRAGSLGQAKRGAPAAGPRLL